MAIPVINHIIPFGSEVGDPSEGPSAGHTHLYIHGRNFNPHPDPPEIGPSGDINSGIVVASKTPSVSVTFGGEEALSVEVISPILVKVITPISPIPVNGANNFGAGSVDVIVTNIDENGDPILGETVTITDGYTYRRPKMDATNPSDLLRLIEVLIHELKRQVFPEVVLTVHTDFDSDTSDALNIVDLASLPSIVISGPDTVESRFYSLNEWSEELVDDDVEIRRKPRTIDLLFDIFVVTDSTMVLINFIEVMNEFMNRNITLSMYRDPDDLSKGKTEYEFGFQTGGEFKSISRPSTSNIRAFSGAVEIRGFDVEGFSSFRKESVRGTAKVVDDILLDVHKISG